MTMRISLPTEKINSFCRKWLVAKLSLFGSVLRDDFSVKSDIDVLVSFLEEADWSLYDWIEMRDELSEIFCRKVDLTAKDGLRNPYRKQEILQTSEAIYAA